jgi:extracellular sulfatase Sulf
MALIVLLIFFCASLFFSTQAYNYAPNPDKQWILRVTDKMQPIHKRFTDLLMTKRLQTLQSVDMAVKRVLFLY